MNSTARNECLSYWLFLTKADRVCRVTIEADDDKRLILVIRFEFLFIFVWRSMLFTLMYIQVNFSNWIIWPSVSSSCEFDKLRISNRNSLFRICSALLHFCNLEILHDHWTSNEGQHPHNRILFVRNWGAKDHEPSSKWRWESCDSCDKIEQRVLSSFYN